MSGVNWKMGLPMPGQPHLINDGRGAGGGREISSITVSNEGTQGGNVDDDIYVHPLDSVDKQKVLDFFNTLSRDMRDYSDRDRNMLAKRLVVRASRVPWAQYPRLSSDVDYVTIWESEIPPRAALYFTRAIAAIGTAELVVDAARFLEERSRNIDNKDALLMMFSSCIEALPQVMHVSMITTLLSAMMCHRDLCDARKLAGRLSKINTIKAAIVALPRDKFGEVCWSLHEVEKKMQTKAGVFFQPADLGEICSGLRGVEERIQAGMRAGLSPEQFAEAYKGVREIEGRMWPGTNFIRVIYNLYFGVDA